MKKTRKSLTLSSMPEPTVTQNPGLVRALGPLTATAVVVGTIIGSGIFKKPALVAASVPDFFWVAVVWVLGGILTFLGALALAEVTVLYPKAGGNYVFLREGFGRLAGFLWGWVEFWIIRAASLAALATVFTESLDDVLCAVNGLTGTDDLLSFWEQRYVTLGVLVSLALVNIRGVRWGGGLQVLVTTVKVLSLLAIILMPLLLLGGSTASNPVVQDAPLRTFTLGGLGTALLSVLWAYHGWMNIAPIAEEVRTPQRTIPVAFLLGTGVVIFLYLGANVAYHLVIPQDEMAALPGGTTVATVFSLRLLGAIGGLLISAAIMTSVFGALNGNLLVGPRLLYAMGKDRLAPHALAAIHPRFHTPARAIAVLTAWAMLLVVGAGAVRYFGLPTLEVGEWIVDINPPASKNLFDMLTDFAMFGAVIFETLAVATIFVFRWREPDAPRPYRCPGYPWVPLIYLVLPAFVLANMFVHQQIEVLVGLGFIGCGMAVYATWLRR